MTANQTLAKLGSAKKPAIKQPKQNKPLSKAMVVVVCVVAFVLLLGGGAACVYLNVGGITPQVIQLLAGLNPSYAQAAKALDKRQKVLDDAQMKLQGDQAALDKAVSANSKGDQALKQKQAKLDTDIKAFESQKAAVQTASPADSQNSVKEIYANMDADVAATMLGKAPTTQEVADILKLLDPAKAAEILAAMDPKKAYEITKLMAK